MKISPILLFIAVSGSLFAQQSVINGVVSIHNSEYETGKRQYVPNATVEDDFEKATQQTTDGNGAFKLVFVGIPEKTSIQLIVKKEGLQVVNIDGLSAVTGQRDLLRLSMAKPDRIAEYRREIYKVGKTEAEKNLAAQLKKKGAQIETLQKDAVKNKAAIEKLQQEYAELQAFASKIEEQAQDLARRYAPVNLDDAAPLYRESFRLFQQGELEKALQILRGADLVGQANKILAEEKRINEGRLALNQQDSIKEQRKQDLQQVLGLKADLHKATFEWDSVWFCLELRVQLDTSNLDNIWTLAYFLGEQNKKYEAIHYYEKALVLSRTSELKAAFQNNLGNLYRYNQKMPQAEGAYNEALKIYRQLADKNPDAFLPDVAMTLNNLGNYYSENQKMPQAEGAYNEALKIRRQLADKNPDAFLPDVAMTLNNLGVFYEKLKQYGKALDHYGEAFVFRERAILEGGTHFFKDWVQVLRNIAEVKDSAAAKKDYPSVVKAGVLLTEGCDNLKGVNEKLLPIAVSEYGSLSWWALFAKDYALSEKAARRCLELDETQIYVLTNLGHSQILRGQYKGGMATYEKLKGKKDDNDKDYRTVILEDLLALEAEGVSHPDFVKVRKDLEKW